MALTYSKEPCDFHDENRWVRGIADLVIIDGADAFVVDYKTGSNKYPDPKAVKANGYYDVYPFSRSAKDKGRSTLCNEEQFLN
jgi:ATP-dependent exoDNAse (exonuclease V) beta subunit